MVWKLTQIQLRYSCHNTFCIRFWKRLICLRKSPQHTAGVIGKAIKKMIYKLSYGLEGPGFVSHQDKKFFSFSKYPDRFWGLSSILRSRIRVSFPGVKLKGRDLEHSSPNKSRLWISGVFLFFPPYDFKIWSGTKLFFFPP